MESGDKGLRVHLKLDELLRVTTEARNAVIGAEGLPERDISDLEQPNREVARDDAFGVGDEDDRGGR